MMTPRGRAIAQIAVLAGVFLLLFLFYPPAVAFVELAAREIRYLWWVVLLVALAAWLIWGVSRKPK
jgi:putative effector of murein hydrolase LrgA (UPF0299 family)